MPMDTVLRRLRVSTKKTLKEVADGVGTDPGNLSRIERGAQTASPMLAEKIVKFFGPPLTEEQVLYPERFVEPTAQTPACGTEAAA